MGRSWRFRNVPVPAEYPVVLAVAFGLHRIRPWPVPGPRGAHRLVGLPLVAAGVLLAAWSVRTAAEVDLARPDRLVRVGPYGRSRNPMYLGWLLASGGVGVVAGASWVLAGVPLAAVRVHHEIRREEGRLAALFGAEFDRYCASVPRYWPVRPAGWARRAQ
ncbi:MAG TPA: isoprenylcysteine carboxylmethyltransferase family protein [Nakamurella sp.]